MLALCVARGAALVQRHDRAFAAQRAALDAAADAHPGVVGLEFQPRRGGACRTRRTRRARRCRDGTATSSRRTTCASSMRRRAPRSRWAKPRRGAARSAALRLAARRRHRGRTHRAVRHAGRAHRTDPPRHQPRHLRPRRAARGRAGSRAGRAGRYRHRRPPAAESPQASGSSVRRKRPARYNSRLACHLPARTGSTPRPRFAATPFPGVAPAAASPQPRRRP